MAAQRVETTKGGTASRHPLRAVGYHGQAENGLGLEVQRDRVTEHAAVKGYELVDVVTEAASGAIRNGEEVSYEHRPVLLELLERAKRSAFDVLLVAKLDRLSRDYPSLAILERKLQKAGVEVVSVAEENGDGPIAAFIRGQLALVAELERAMILDRIGAGKAKGKQRGAFVGGRVPYGYVSVGKGQLEPSEQAPIVRRIFERAKGGASPARIARELSAEGVPTPQGGQGWTRQAVRVVLSNPIYAGERYGVKGAQPAIVSKRLWNAANHALKATGRH
jgi:DNA invertase Pin-like site-specific DNA recombinase